LIPGIASVVASLHKCAITGALSYWCNTEKRSDLDKMGLITFLEALSGTFK